LGSDVNAKEPPRVLVNAEDLNSRMMYRDKKSPQIFSKADLTGFNCYGQNIIQMERFQDRHEGIFLVRKHIKIAQYL
jgi:hypothetical protein